ncbi:MAG: hypothetical protein HY698_10265 [Deltaproteobacteria bacterium]|nr:hypothetical protein [Deltaproteobacteria bacterium]
MTTSTTRLGAILVLGILSCGRSHRDDPAVQFSSDRPRDTDVKISKTLEFSPACVTVKVGTTIEWWIEKGAPRVPVNVTSLGTPVELFSPNLVPPLFCDEKEPDKICWRRSFEQPGCFPYYDTNSGSPGRPVVDDYYGTTTYVGQGGDIQGGLVCVEGSGLSCKGVCCNANFDCDQGFTCHRGRCVKAGAQEASPCPAPRIPDAAPSPQPPDAGAADATAEIIDASPADAVTGT